MSADLVAFLRACLGEDERIAKLCGTYPPDEHYDWKAQDLDQWDDAANFDEEHRPDAAVGFRGGNSPLVYAYWAEDANHIARHDPARVLREVEAKREIVELRDAWAAAMSPAPSADLAARLADQVHAADMILRLLALPYADHPDYREEWKP